MTDAIEPTNVNVSGDDPVAELVATTLKNAAANGLVATRNGVSEEEATTTAILAVLDKLGGSKTQEDALNFSGTQFVIPETYRGDFQGAINFLTKYHEQLLAPVTVERTFPYRPFDVAHALQATLKRIFGTTGKGVAVQQLFGSIEPTMLTVNTGVNGATTQVPWHRIAFELLNGYIDVEAQNTVNGYVGQLRIKVPRMNRGKVEGLFIAIADELKRNSLYRGKAIAAKPGEDFEFEFLDLSKVNAANVFYGDGVMRDLEANLWIPVRHTQELRDAALPLKRAVLLEGPHGTGKTLAAFLTAQIAVANNWTFIFVKPGGDLNESLQMAQLYAPAIVFFEDIDVVMSNDPDAISKLLDNFDGLSGKGSEIMMVLTTNYVERLHKGMLRPGRLDALIHIAEMDAGGVERLIKSHFGSSSLDLSTVDYEAVYKACEGYVPAFVTEVATRAARYAMVREGVKVKSLHTADFLGAAEALIRQRKLMADAYETTPPPALDVALHNIVKGVLESTTFKDVNGDPSYYVSTAEVASLA